MKTNYEHGQLIMLPETPVEERFCVDIVRRMTDSNRLMGWYGDCRMDGKETSGYKISYLPGTMSNGTTEAIKPE